MFALLGNEYDGSARGGTQGRGLCGVGGNTTLRAVLALTRLWAKLNETGGGDADSHRGYFLCLEAR